VTSRGLVLYHRLADPASASVRIWIVERGLKSRIDFQNIENEGAEAFAALGGGAGPALWDGARLHVGPDDIRLALGAIIAAEERSIT
jgi:hypothetical protein